MMTTRKIATSTLWQLGSQGVTMLIGILSIKFVTAALSQSLVGNYHTVYAYLQIFGILADFGLYAVAVRELSRAENKASTFSNLFLLRACITVLSLGIALFFAWIIPTFRGTPLPLGISIAMFVPFFTLLSGMFRMVFQVEYRMHYVFGAEVAGKVVPVILMGAAVFLGVQESQSLKLYYIFLAFGGVGALALFILSIWFSRGLLTVYLGLPGQETANKRGLPLVCQQFAQIRQGFAKAEFLRLAKLAAPFGLAFLAMTIYRQSDVTLIALLRPHDYDIQNAYYGVVLRIAEMGFLLPTFLLNSVLPILSVREQRREDTSHFLGQILLGLLTLGSIVSIFAFFWAKPIVLLLTRESYLSTALQPGSDTALQLLSFSMFLSVIISFCFYLLLSKNIWKPLLLVMSGAAVLSVSLNLFLIPVLGFVGAAITSIFVHLLLAISLTTLTLRCVRVYLGFTQFARWFAFSVTLALLLYWSSSLLQNSLITLVASGVGIAVAALLLQLFGLVPAEFLRKEKG